jgi:hypothetical protein
MFKRGSLAVIVSLLLTPVSSFAADHADGTPANLDKPDASSDITDLFAWMSSDAKTVNLVIDVYPKAVSGTAFSDAVKYVFHLDSKASLLAAPTSMQIICTFATNQNVSCWVVNGTTTVDYVNGNASSTNGLASSTKKLKVFTGLRNDPFFFNLAGFKNATATVAQAVAAFESGNTTYIQSINAAGCPLLQPGIANALLSLLGHDCSANALASTPVVGAAAVDAFAVPGPNATGAGGCVNQNLSGDILALVVSVDKSLVTPGGPILGVWASTNM